MPYLTLRNLRTTNGSFIQQLFKKSLKKEAKEKSRFDANQL